MLKLKQHRSKQQCRELERGTQFSKIVCSHYCFECGYGCAAAAGPPPPPSGQGQQQRRRLGPSPSLSSAGGGRSAEPRSPWWSSESSGRRWPATSGGVHGCSSVMSVQALRQHKPRTSRAQSRRNHATRKRRRRRWRASAVTHSLTHSPRPRRAHAHATHARAPHVCPHTLRLPRSARALELLSENASRR